MAREWAPYSRNGRNSKLASKTAKAGGSNHRKRESRHRRRANWLRNTTKVLYRNFSEHCQSYIALAKLHLWLGYTWAVISLQPPRIIFSSKNYRPPHAPQQ